MTQKDKNQLLSFLLLTEQMVGIQENYTAAKKNGEAGKAADLSRLFVQIRGRVKERLTECKAIVSADQGELFV